MLIILVKSIMTIIMSNSTNLSSLEKANLYKYPNSKSLITKNIFKNSAKFAELVCNTLSCLLRTIF